MRLPGDFYNDISSTGKTLLITILNWVCLLVFYFGFRWYSFFLPNEKENFGDLKYVLACGGFHFPNPPTTSCDYYIYGQFLLKFLQQTEILHPYGELVATIIVLVSLVAVAVMMTEIRKPAGWTFVFLIVLSPPIALLIQRGNIDVLMFFLVWVSLNLLSRGHQTLAIAAVVIATLIKIYTLPLVVLYSIISLTKRFSISKLFYLSGICLFSTWSALADIASLSWLPADARNSFGLPIWGEYLNYLIRGPGSQGSRWISNVAGLVILLFLTFVTSRSKVGGAVRSLNLTRNQTIWILNFLFVFSAGISIDYRLIFLVPCLLPLIQLNSRSKLYVVGLVASTFIFSYPFERLQVLGDMTLFSLVALLILMICRWQTTRLFTNHSW